MKKGKKPTPSEIRRVLRYFDMELHVPLSIDDMLYARWRIESRIFEQRLSQWKRQLWDEWAEKYTIRYHDGYYERGQLVEKVRVPRGLEHE